jgi:hypothetical protein
MGATNKILFLPFNPVVHFVLFFILWNSLVNLNLLKPSFLKEFIFSFRNLFLFIFIDQIIALKRNNNKDIFSRDKLCCWVRDRREILRKN